MQVRGHYLVAFTIFPRVLISVCFTIDVKATLVCVQNLRELDLRKSE